MRNTKKAMTEEVDQILEKWDLKKTPLRRCIMMAFIKAQGSLTQADLIDVISKDLDTVDRVSVYRTLLRFKAVGVLHEVDVNTYVYCSHKCHQDHAHLLLFCQKCRKHQEVKDHGRIDHFVSTIGEFKFFDKKQPMFVRGVCHRCRD